MEGKLRSILIILTLVFTSLSIGVNAVEISETKNSVNTFTDEINEHEDITINGNEDFTKENGIKSGSGTEIDPYIISNWDVDTIVIKDTHDYFCINYCNVREIVFDNVLNGEIVKCNLKMKDPIQCEGITLYFSDFCDIRDCYIEKPIQAGIRLTNSDYINIISCEINGKSYGGNYAIMSNSESENIYISKCTIYDITNVADVYSHDSSFIFADNDFLNCDGFYLSGNNNKFYENNLINIIIFDITGENNYFYKNNFISIGNFKFNSGLICFKNWWYKDGVGNYYDFYNGYDKDGDGIADSPLVLSNSNYEGINIDLYPLMHAYGINSDSPTVPVKPEGTLSGKKGKSYSYSTSATDLDQDIKYCFDWGDGTIEWTDFYQSGETATLEHRWIEESSYNIKVKAKDRYGYESDWSDSLEIFMPKTKVFTNTFFGKLLERFPILSNFFFF